MDRLTELERQSAHLSNIRDENMKMIEEFTENESTEEQCGIDDYEKYLMITRTRMLCVYIDMIELEISYRQSKMELKCGDATEEPNEYVN